MLELALWKAKMNEESKPINCGGRNKKVKIDELDFRSQCRISCGADSIIENVLPYLLPAAEKKGIGSGGEGGDVDEEGDSSEEVEDSSDEDGYSSEDDDMEEEP